MTMHLAPEAAARASSLSEDSVALGFSPLGDLILYVPDAGERHAHRDAERAWIAEAEAHIAEAEARFRATCDRIAAGG